MSFRTKKSLSSRRKLCHSRPERPTMANFKGCQQGCRDSLASFDIYCPSIAARQVLLPWRPIGLLWFLRPEQLPGDWLPSQIPLPVDQTTTSVWDTETLSIQSLLLPRTLSIEGEQSRRDTRERIFQRFSNTSGRWDHCLPTAKLICFCWKMFFSCGRSSKPPWEFCWKLLMEFEWKNHVLCVTVPYVFLNFDLTDSDKLSALCVGCQNFQFPATSFIWPSPWNT